VADPEYDSTENASYLLGENITPYIAQTPRGKENPIHRGDITISADGRFLFKAGWNSTSGEERRGERGSCSGVVFIERGLQAVFSEGCAGRAHTGLPSISKKTRGRWVS